MIKFGFCGCGGFIEKAVLPMMARVPAAKAFAAFDANEATRNRVCDAFHIERRCATFEELLEQDADVIYIASPNVFHHRQVLAAAKAGKHVFCQKPMGMNARECEEMAAACRDRGVKMGVGFCYRFQGAQEAAKRMIHDGTLGKVSHLYMSFNLGGYNKETAGWRCDPKMSGGGPLMDLAPHLVDLARWLLDDEVVSVMAYADPERDENTIELDSDAILEFAGGARAEINTSFVRGNVHNYTVVGTKGQLRAMGTMCWNNTLPDIGKGRLHLEHFMDSNEVEFTTEEHLEKEIRLFCAALETGREPPVSGVDGWKAQQIIDAIYESGRTGRRVDLNKQEKSCVTCKLK